MPKFIVIGIEDSVHFNSLAPFNAEGLHIFSGGKRHYNLVKEYLPKGALWIDIIPPMDNLFSIYEKYKEETIVVFASGDPLFFGFAVTIKKRLPNAEIIVYPTFNSLQKLAHKFSMEYHNLTVVSLTGRPWDSFDAALIERREKIGILTDNYHTPKEIAKRALLYGYNNYRVYVGENLGGEEEKLYNLTLYECAEMNFAKLNCLIMVRESGRGIYKESVKRYFGIPHKDFALLNNREKMITKMPVRLLSLSMLDLYDRKTLWDIGFCTGSLSIEAKMQFPHLKISAFEIREEGRDLLDINSRRFGTPGIDCHIVDFTTLNLEQLLSNGTLTTPDSVFIGGHGGKLERVVEMLSKVMQSGGVVVFNSVKEPETFCNALVDNGFTLVDKVDIKIDEYNKITCCKGVKI